MSTTPTAVDPLARFRLDGRTAVVTGASSGLGARFAEVLHGVGANVVLAARRAGAVEDLAGRLGDRALAVPADVTDEAQCRRLVGAAVERFGSVDVLVNNAGSNDQCPFEELDPADWRRIMAVNVDAVFLLSKLAGTCMLEQGSGVIVNVASIMGMVGIGQIPQAAYNTSKGAVINLTRELAAQWARRGVRVNALCPGFFRTEMTEELMDDPGGAKFLRRKTPLGRTGEPHELDGALLYLASDASSFVTGSTLVVDGGWTAI